jgi:hypothetical protein
MFPSKEDYVITCRKISIWHSEVAAILSLHHVARNTTFISFNEITLFGFPAGFIAGTGQMLWACLYLGRVAVRLKHKHEAQTVTWNYYRKYKFFPVYAMKACRGSEFRAPFILYFGTRWR